MPPPCTLPAASRARCVAVSARRRPGDSGMILGGGPKPGGGRPGAPGGGGLILPGEAGGRPGGGGPAPRILLPNEKFAGGPGGGGMGGGPGIMGPGGTGAAGLDTGIAPGTGPGGDRPLPNRYRPPPGFMDAAGPRADGDVAALSMSDDALLGKLRSRAGHWFQLARLIPALNAKGYDSNAIDEATGITPVEQNLWVVAATVYDSLAAAAAAAGGADGGESAALLEHFQSGGEALLYHFRFLPAERRVDAARYIAANDLTAPECEVLARAMKEWDRRPSERHGFDNSAADCLAFKYLRDAIECRHAEDAYAKLDLADAAAASDGAKARLAACRRDIDAAEAARAGGGAGLLASGSMLTTLRLSPDELGVRPIPQLRPLGAATADELASAPSASQSGAFGAFTLAAPSARADGAPHTWVALPQWKALSLARKPAALPVPDCSRDAAITTASRAKTDDDKRRMVGPGLLVVDAHVEPSAELDPTAYYLVDANGALQLMDGRAAAARGGGGAPAAVVLFLARPPAREGAPAATTSELLQV